jgi:hypothetical protein
MKGEKTSRYGRARKLRTKTEAAKQGNSASQRALEKVWEKDHGVRPARDPSDEPRQFGIAHVRANDRIAVSRFA